jgi:hypothetical protein
MLLATLFDSNQLSMRNDLLKGDIAREREVENFRKRHLDLLMNRIFFF